MKPKLSKGLTGTKETGAGVDAAAAAAGGGALLLPDEVEEGANGSKLKAIISRSTKDEPASPTLCSIFHSSTAANYLIR